MKFYGEAHLQQNYLREAVIPLDTYFPITPKIGQVVFKDRILYICVDIVNDLPTWIPLTNEISVYTHIQNVDAVNWTITHNLNTSNVSVMVYDNSNRVVIPDEITINSNSQITTSFSSATQGKVVVVTGSQDGQERPTYAYEFYQTEPSTSWVISHGLGRYPIVRIFVGNQEVQPLTITFNTLDTVTVTFTTPQVGQAKLL